MFRGSSSHSCDPKGRLIVPSRFRDVIQNNGADGLVITKGNAPCLMAFSYDEWKKFELLVNGLKTPNSGKLKRRFIGNAQECPCDKQGRILIPKDLREYAKIDKDLRLIGLIDRFEIWSFENWANEDQDTNEGLLSGGYNEELAVLGL